MKAYVSSLAVGVLVGVIYNLLNVRSPAPPLVALVGLFGMLVGEQVIPTARQAVARYIPAATWQQVKCGRLSCLVCCPAAVRTKTIHP